MRKTLLILFLFLAACSQGGKETNHHSVEKTETIIDWIDFIKMDGEQYEALYTAVIAEEKFIGTKMGEIDFKVSDNIDDPAYRIQNGDAAFWEEGTVVYHIKNRPDLIAVKDDNEINHYRIYQSDSTEEMWRFEHIDKEDIIKIEIWEDETNPKRLQTISNEKDINALLAILEESKQREEDVFYENDPDSYGIVLYQEEPIAYYFPLFHYEGEWYWLPWEEEILTDDIKEYMEDAS